MSATPVYPEMTIQEIETQFDGEWVLVGDPETDEFLQVTRGKVLSHSVDRDVVYAAMPSAGRQFKRTATLCNIETTRYNLGLTGRVATDGRLINSNRAARISR